jgi:hypothetical protein
MRLLSKRQVKELGLREHIHNIKKLAQIKHGAKSLKRLVSPAGFEPTTL